MGQEIAKDTRRSKAEAKRMAGGQVTGHEVTDEERLKAWEDQTTADELQVLSAVHAEAKAYAARSARRHDVSAADKARPRGSPSQKRSDSEVPGRSRTCAWRSTGPCRSARPPLTSPRWPCWPSPAPWTPRWCR